MLLAVGLAVLVPSTGSFLSSLVSRFQSFQPSLSNPSSTISARAARTTFTVSVRA